MACCEDISGRCYIGNPLKDKESKYAICTLLTNGDSYLPGIMELGWSLHRLVRNKNIDFVLMITNDVSSDSIECAKTVYDRVIQIPTIQISEKYIPHKDKETRIRYSKLFTKFGYLLLTKYKKVLYLDADMIVLKKEIVNLFNLDTPAAVFYGCSDAYKDKHYKENVCSHSKHGFQVKENLKCKRVKENMAFETSLVLIQPSIQQYIEIIKKIKNIKSKIKSDTGFFNMFFGKSIHAINLNFLGRWVDPKLNNNIITLDAYGYLYKPWDPIQSIYPDVLFWREMYCKDMKKYMKNQVIKSNSILMKTYKQLQQINK
jgi:lipopolysaccharide biosynthesis glycosyltransferase